MKKILLVIDNLGSGGAQNQITLLALGLKKQGYDVTVFTYYPEDFYSKRLENNKINVIKKLKKGKIGINIILSLKKLLNEHDFDCLISFLDTPNFYVALANSLIKPNIRHIISYRSMTDFSKLSYLKLKQLEWVNKRASFIVANSFHEKNRWIARYPDLKQKFSTIYNCINKSIFYPINNVSRNNTFLVIGSISPAKNGMLVLKALRILLDEGIDVSIHWIGRVDMHIKERRDYYMKMNNYINTNNLNSHWKWIEPTKDIAKFYQSYKALILASVREGLPNVVCEAQSCGMPCIVSNVLDHDKLIKDDISGYLFDSNNPKSLAQKMKYIYSLNNKEYNKLISNTIEVNKDNYSFDKFINSFVTICNS